MRRYRGGMTKLLSLWLVAITAVVGYLAVHDAPPAHAANPPKKLVLEELDVQRVNIVEPDGKPRVILTSGARFPGAYFGGKEYPHPGRKPGTTGGGLLFFNDEGTEAGGLIYGNRNKDNEALLSFDQHEQNELLALTYSRGDKRRAGLSVYNDRPDASLLPLIQRSAEIAKLTDPAARAQAEQRLDREVPAVVGTQATRVFVGKDGDDAQLVLGDRTGKPRLVLKVDARGEPTVELLDAAGVVVKRIAAR